MVIINYILTYNFYTRGIKTKLQCENLYNPEFFLSTRTLSCIRYIIMKKKRNCPIGKVRFLTIEKMNQIIKFDPQTA